MRPAWIWAAAGLGFCALLFTLSLSLAPEGPPSGVDHSAAAAEHSCQLAVRDSLGNVAFPFTADATYLGESSYHLAGIADIDDPGGTLRNNYDCWVRYVGDQSYRTDSLHLWQSH